MTVNAAPPDTPCGAPSARAGRHVFVYGTLRRGGANDITRLLPAPVFVGGAATLGSMYDFGTYPGVVLQRSKQAGSHAVLQTSGAELGNIVGEVYAIEPALERKLDEIEELYPQQKDEYFKRLIMVQVGAHRLNCLVYEINATYVADKSIIASGDWMNRCPGTAVQTSAELPQA